MKKVERFSRPFHFFKKICKILGKKFKFFKQLHKYLIELEKSFILFRFTGEFISNQQFKFTVVDEIKYPTVETIKKLHDFLVFKYQKEADKIHGGDLSLAPLEFEGIKYWLEKLPNPEEDLILRGAHIFNKFLEEGHPFVDGNKRTGWATLWVFLAANGLYFTFPDNYHGGKQARKVESWATLREDGNNINEIVTWIKKYVRKKK